MNLEQLKTAFEKTFPESKGEPRVKCLWGDIDGESVLMLHVEGRLLVLDQAGTARAFGNCPFPT